MADAKWSAQSAASSVADTDYSLGVVSAASKTFTFAVLFAQFLAAARTFAGKITLSGGYNETAELLTQSGGSVTIVLGKNYKLVPSEAITEITVTAPTAPICSGSIIDVVQGATGYAVSYPSGWLWPAGTVTDIDDTASAITTLILRSDYDGSIHAAASVRSAA